MDEYWDKLVSAGATPSQCGWITDPFGVTWQIVPRRFMELISDQNTKKVQAVMDAMMTMVTLGAYYAPSGRETTPSAEK